MKSGDCELCPSKTAGNKIPWKIEAWQQLPSTIILNISSLPRDVIPGCDRKFVLCAHLFPAMNLSTGMGGESGNEVAMTSGSGVPLQTDSTWMSKGSALPGLLIRAHPDIIHHHWLGWCGLTVVAFSEILGKHVS